VALDGQEVRAAGEQLAAGIARVEHRRLPVGSGLLALRLLLTGKMN
jgi:hypothetical protein